MVRRARRPLYLLLALSLIACAPSAVVLREEQTGWVWPGELESGAFDTRNGWHLAQLYFRELESSKRQRITPEEEPERDDLQFPVVYLRWPRQDTDENAECVVPDPCLAVLIMRSPVGRAYLDGHQGSVVIRAGGSTAAIHGRILFHHELSGESYWFDLDLRSIPEDAIPPEALDWPRAEFGPPGLRELALWWKDSPKPDHR